MLGPQDLGWFFSGLPCMGLLCIAKGLQSPPSLTQLGFVSIQVIGPLDCSWGRVWYWLTLLHHSRLWGLVVRDWTDLRE